MVGRWLVKGWLRVGRWLVKGSLRGEDWRLMVSSWLG